MEEASEGDPQLGSPYCYHEDITTCGYTEGYAILALNSLLKTDKEIGAPTSDNKRAQDNGQDRTLETEGKTEVGGYTDLTIQLGDIARSIKDGGHALNPQKENKTEAVSDQQNIEAKFRRILQPSGEREERSFKRYMKKLKKAQQQPVPFSIWNERFQELMGKPDSIEKFHDLARLAHDNMPPQSMAALLLGGVAGGDKYIVRGILFKYAMDKNLGNAWMYGGHYPNDANAMKAAGHELRYHARVIDYGAPKDGILCPLMALIDYRGFRLVATSVIPVNSNTLIYGSANAGRTVHSDFTVCNEKLAKLFHRMNLKPHIVKNTTLGACGDIEGHLGMDGNFYLLDFARLYPPESLRVQAQYFPLADSRSVFYKALRPELVAQNPVPLCSDAFTGWLSKDPDFQLHNEEVSEATALLYRKVIPNVMSLWMVTRAIDMIDYEMELVALHRGDPNPHTGAYGTPGPSHVNRETLCKYLHQVLHSMRSAGVNRRCLGVMRNDFSSNEEGYLVPKALVYTEMAARVCKNIIRALLRETLKNLTVPTSEPEREIVLALFNVFSGYSVAMSEKFWTSTEIPEVEGFPPSSLAGDLEFYIYHASKLLMENKKKGITYTREEEISYLLSKMLPMKLAIKAKFGHKALTEEEWNCVDRSKPFLFQGILFQRVCEMLGITLEDEPSIFDELNGYRPMPIPDPHEFMDHHILELNAKVKQMHLTAASEGFSLLQQCEDLDRGCADTFYMPNPPMLKKILRLLKLALTKLEVAIQLIPDSLHTLSCLGKVEGLLGLYLPAEDEVRRRALFEESVQRLAQARICVYAMRSEDPIIDNTLLLKHTMEFVKMAMHFSCVFTRVLDNWWPAMWDIVWQHLVLQYPYDISPLWKNQINSILTPLAEGKAVRAGEILVALLQLLTLWKLKEYSLRYGEPWQKPILPMETDITEKEKVEEKEKENDKHRGDVFIQSMEGEYVTSKMEGKKVKAEGGMSTYAVFYPEWIEERVLAIRHTYSGRYLCGDKEGNALSYLSPLHTNKTNDARLWEVTTHDDGSYSFKNVLNGKWLGIQKHVLVNNSLERKKENHFKISSVEGSRVYVRNGYGMYLHCGEGVESITSHNIYISRGISLYTPTLHISATMRVPTSIRNIFFVEAYVPPSPSMMASLLTPFLEKQKKEIAETKQEEEQGFSLRAWDGRYIAFSNKTIGLTLHPTQPSKWEFSTQKKEEREKKAEREREEDDGVSISIRGKEEGDRMYLFSRRDGVVFMGSKEVKRREEQNHGGGSLMEYMREESFNKGVVYAMKEDVAEERAAFYTTEWNMVRADRWEGVGWHRDLHALSTAFSEYNNNNNNENSQKEEEDVEWLVTAVMATPTPKKDVSNPITRLDTTPPTRNGWAWLVGTGN